MHADMLPVATRPRTLSWIGAGVLACWLGYLLIAPTIGFQWIESWHNEQRAVQLVLLACTAAAFCVLKLHADWDRMAPWRAFWPVAALLLVIGVVSGTRAAFPFAAYAEIGLITLLVILSAFTASFVSAEPQRYVRWARWFALLYATAYVLGVATRYMAAVNIERQIDLDVLILGYANPRFPSALHALLIPFIAVFAADREEKRWLRISAALVLSFLWAINLGLGTRAIWFAYAIAIPLTVLLVGWRPLARPAAVIALTTIVGAVLYYILFAATPTVTGLGAAVASPMDNATLTSRDVIWRLSREAIVSSPWLGIGPMQFAALDSRVGAHPHNWVLQIGAEWGLPALGLVLFGVVQLGRSVAGTAARLDPTLVAPALGVSIALAYGLVDGNLVMPVSQSAVALIIGMLLGVASDRSTHERRTFSSSLTLTGLGWVVASAVVIAFGATTLPDQERGISRFQRTHPGAWLVPRFWEQGLLFHAHEPNRRQ